MSYYEVEVPGTFAEGSAFLDLETVKVPTGGFEMRNGEILRNRWSIAMAGTGLNGKIGLLVADGGENEMLAAIADGLATADEVVYGATREFDEMICKGRFTNARRAHEPEPFYPAVPYADELPWRNVGVGKSGAFRAADVPSRDVPKTLAKGGWEIVLIHLLRDVADLILEAGNPDATCAAWCGAILASEDFARSTLVAAGV